MCLILLALKSHPACKLILAANRDEYYDRPTAPAAFWKGAPDLLAGKDLRAGGTWLGITTKGRIAAITNYRDLASDKNQAISRGKLVADFLLGQESAIDYLTGLEQQANEYNGFNLIIGEKKDGLYWYSNRSNMRRNLAPGVHGVSNHLLNTPWPKVTWGKEGLNRVLLKQESPSPKELFRLLQDRRIPDDDTLPDTGAGPEWERIVSPIFIESPTYGTRSSTIVLIDQHDHVTFIERTFNSDLDNTTTVKYEFPIQP